jgi:hypothetical protein
VLAGWSRSSFLLSRKLTAKNTGKKFDCGSFGLREALENPCAAGTSEHFRAAPTAQRTGNGCHDIRERFSKNRECGRGFPSIF